MPIAGTRLRALLTRLAVAAPEPVSIAELVQALWSGEPPGDPTNALQSLVSRVRRALGDAARIEWEYAQEVRLDSPLVAGLSAALGLTDETLDNLYKVAAGL